MISTIILYSFFLIVSGEPKQAESLCEEGWDVYGNDNCIKFIKDTLKNYDDAMKACQGLGATLLTIESSEEQNSINELLFQTHKIVDEIWIGGKEFSMVFKPADGTGPIFTNWAKDNPSNEEDNACVELMSADAAQGKWSNVPCTNKNLIVCQKIQTWSTERLQRSLRKALKDIETTKNDLEASKKNQDKAKQEIKQKIATLAENPVPIGFIYVQYANQTDPNKLWPSVTFTDVTKDYMGQFFRAEGGGSEAFGKVQEDSSPRISQVSSTGVCSSSKRTIQVRPGQFSDYLGRGRDGTNFCIRFFQSDGEVRPRNQAVRIFKRTK